MKRIKLIGVMTFALLSATATVSAEECTAAGTVGTGGSAAAGGTSASSVGTAGVCQTEGGTTSSIGSGGSAAAVDGKATSKTHVNDNSEKLKAQTKAQAVDNLRALMAAHQSADGITFDSSAWIITARKP